MTKLQVGFLAIVFSVFAFGQSASFTPTSIKRPIRAIALEGSGGNSSMVYECSADTEAGCMVEVTDNTALEALFATPATPDAGTYNSIRIYSCKEEGGYSAQVKGTVSIGGTSYGTSSSAEALVAAGTPEYVTVSYSGCASSYNLPADLVVASGGAATTISLLFDVTKIAWGNDGSGTGGNTTIPSGCKEGTTKDVCMGYPDVVPYVGTVSPTVKHFHVCDGGTTCNADTSNGQVILLFDAASNMLGGFTRRLFNDNTTTSRNYDTALRIYTSLGSGMFQLENYGSSATTSYLVFSSFDSTATHSGSFTETGGSAVNYQAHLIP